jgi:hypothetical protein
MRCGDFRNKRSTQLVDSDNVWENQTVISPFGIAADVPMPKWQSRRNYVVPLCPPIDRKWFRSSDLLFTRQWTNKPASKLLYPLAKLVRPKKLDGLASLPCGMGDARFHT